MDNGRKPWRRDGSRERHDRADVARSVPSYRLEIEPLYGVENVPQHRWGDFESIRARAKKTARAWSIKETLRVL